MDLEKSFGGRHALITGGSTGIGAALAARLTSLGCGVTLVARRPEPLVEAAENLRAAAPGITVRTLTLDVADQAAVAESVPRELAERPTDLIVNNAGIAHAGRFEDTDPSAFRRLVDVNYLGTVWVTRAAVPHLRAQRHGHLVNVASMAAIEGIYGYSAYAPSKFAVLGFSEVMRAELKPHGIGVSVLLPPNTDTPQLAAETEQLPPEMRRIHETSSVVGPERVAEALLEGVARDRFEIIPGLEGKALARLHRLSARPLRAYFDRAVGRALSEGASSSSG